MARYTGPQTKIARKFGEAIFGDDKSFEKITHPDNTGWQRKEVKIRVRCPAHGKAESKIHLRNP
jgi:hypothetical protein